jgi:hypothetical protein
MTMAGEAGSLRWQAAAHAHFRAVTRFPSRQGWRSGPFAGNAGWRLLSLPHTISIQDFSTITHIQGVQGLTNFATSATNIFTNLLSNQWQVPQSSSVVLEKGYGFVQYFYNNTNTPNSELPLVISSNGVIDTSDVEVTIANTNGFNMIGNPFDKPIQFSDLSVNSGILLDIGWLWNLETGWTPISRVNNDLIPPYSGFFVETQSAIELHIPFSSRTNSENLKQSNSKNKIHFSLLEKNGVPFNSMDAGAKILIGNSLNDSITHTTKKPSPLTSPKTYPPSQLTP